MITIRNLVKRYRRGDREVLALDGVSLEVQPGEIFGVLGRSGAGKSTLIRCVNLLERPTEGTIQVAGQEMTTLSGDQLRRARQQIGMIFQHFNLLQSRTVANNVALPLEIVGYEKQARDRRVAELLGLVGLAEQADAYPAQLSGGQKQRVGIARALAAEPRVLLSDESTSSLDPHTTREILGLLRALKERLGLTILLITHEMEVVKQICDRVAVLEAGRVVEQGPVAQLATRPGSMLGRELFPAWEETEAATGSTLARITFLGDAAGEPVISTLVRRFGIDANIIGGTIETIGGERVGQLQVELTGRQTEEALRYVRDLGLLVEVEAK